ncbi:WcaI family glycosyltransferase [Cyanobium sp. Aljojuca 7D2]|uniref:WcaI family glycosyltransferase n=1 Tax=Cyanobium sp. Aljojuca 7D2 TaxID=2823698 RepID=UPI0020CC7F1C|nr:WcaI family glycosyltransferase [Cyanobium sp. Aljojuca 7D2]MCP9890278.1 WcaI family glycosyltransferase [Cyanobium sp. Aljojuca 7D2]
MRVLVYGLNYAPEPVGIGKYSGELAEWLAARGHQVRVVTAVPYFPQWRAVGNRYRRERRAGVELWRCPLWVPRRPTGLTRLLHLLSFALSSLPVLLGQVRWRPQVVLTVAPAFFCAPGALLLGRLGGQGTRTWLHIQDFELDAAFALGLLQGRWLRGLAESWERRTLRGFARVSTISGAMRQRALDKGVTGERALLLPNWVDLAAIRPQNAAERAANPYRRELGLSAEQLVLLYSGSMNRKQGLELLVDVIRELGNLPQLVWLLAGEGPSKAELAAATAGLANVRLLPLQPAERLHDWLNLADVHLLPQRAGAADLVLPSKLLGILASGRPVVASSPAASELGQLAEQAGLRVEPEDPAAFAAAVRQLVGDGALRQRLGAQARQLVEQRYGREAVLGEMEGELQRLASRGR